MSAQKLPNYLRFNTALHLARKSIYTVRHYGWRDFYLKVKRKLFSSRLNQQAWNKAYASKALTLAAWLDCTPADLEKSRATMAANCGPLDIKSINWYLPHFDHAYYGGVHTILRFAANFAQQFAVHNTFVILGDANVPAAPTYIERISKAFPVLSQSQAVVIRSDADLGDVPPAHACVATFWSTAYYVLKFDQTRRKFYFLQDFEPMFYPAGSTSAQVEASYRFGFYGITNTITLKRLYEEHYQGKAAYFDPCVNTDLFYPPASRDWGATTQPYTVFFYARPNYWRNGFELGTVALRKLKERFGQQVRIISAGEQWDPAEYGMEGIIENLGLLSYEETTTLYRTCDVGLAMMFTRHPSYLPFELMASGCLVVSNVNSATAWLLKDNENCLLALPSASCIADALARGLYDYMLRRRITTCALEQIRQQFADWDQQIDRIYRYMCDPETTV